MPNEQHSQDRHTELAALASARETVKRFALEELGLEIGRMERDEAIVIILAALITKRKTAG